MQIIVKHTGCYAISTVTVYDKTMYSQNQQITYLQTLYDKSYIFGETATFY